MTSLHSARSRLAQLRNKLHAELSALKSSSTKHKKTEGRLGGVMDAIQILDEEMLAGEQGRPVGRTATAIVLDEVSPLTADQVAWLEKWRGRPFKEYCSYCGHPPGSASCQAQHS